VDALEHVTREKGLRWGMLMVTDVMKRNSLLLTSGYVDAEQLLPFSHIADQTFDMPGVLSRKKQLLPEVMRVLSEVGS
jgi:manganese-dependent inorganic pyrophosphatase